MHSLEKIWNLQLGQRCKAEKASDMGLEVAFSGTAVVLELKSRPEGQWQLAEAAEDPRSLLQTIPGTAAN